MKELEGITAGLAGAIVAMLSPLLSIGALVILAYACDAIGIPRQTQAIAAFTVISGAILFMLFWGYERA